MDTITFYGKEKISKILLKLAPSVMLAQLVVDSSEGIRKAVETIVNYVSQGQTAGQ